MATINNALDQHTFKKLSRLYIIALSAIALTVVVSQILIRKHLNDQQSDSTVINVAGRQRMLSQKLTKEILLLTTVSDEEKRIELKNQLKKTLSLWEVSHVSLQKGNDSLGLPKKNSETVTQLFSQLNPIFTTIESATKTIIQKLETKPLIPIEDFIDEVEKVKKNESSFLTLMDKIVNQYDAEANEKVSWLRNLEMILMALTLLLLLGELLFVFWPTAKTVKKSISELLEAEKKAKKMAYDADVLSIDKINSTKELRALNHAMDETLLFARITSNGNIVHIGNKFSRLFKYTNFSSNANFMEVISSHENEQAIFENIIANYKKTGWQGEVKATTKDDIAIWLEMAIIPFNPTDDKSELLIIASDISKRKKAQLEIERLTQLNFEEKITQQKVVSSKIIENLEKEQNRIAQDVHDGIGQMLTGLKYNLESIDPKDVEKTTTKVELLKKQSADIIKGIRTATFNLTPPELSDHGIVPAITKLTKELAKLTGKNIIFYPKENCNQRLDALVEINIYRITQEAINNAIKYADSTNIIVTLSCTEKMLSIVIDDDGKGFDSNAIKSEKNAEGGMGMAFMKERIKYINGRLFLNSQPNEGTRVTLNVPIE